jgi:anti-sigma factor RsiW
VSAEEATVTDRARALMMAVLDGESTAAEREELDRLLAGDDTLRAEWARLARVKEATTTMTVRRPSDETWDRYWSSVYNRSERKVAWLLVLAGLVVLVAYWLWLAVPELAEGLLGATNVPVVVRAAVAAVLTGGVLLVISVVREQLSTRRHDSYQKGVNR